ncbi:phage terminase large subunit family protein [Gluconacetobacter entanii]|uniref:phage terminase large subunit family protein n=1 Tax=Gluconacetobacter entanii TaxID=108528 RepID=UPI001ABFA6C3|nr:terminase [Gluconacetobacter entanii]
MARLRKAERPKLTRPQWNIYQHGWRPECRFRVAVCGRRFGKTFEAQEEMRRAVRMAVKHDIGTENEIWYGAPTFKQAKRVMWNRLKKAFPENWLAKKPNESECNLTMKSGHIVRIVGLDNYDNLRGSGLWFFLGDEWADTKPEAWRETIRPMLSTAGGHGLFIGTPKGFNHFRDAYLRGQPGPQHEDGWWSCLYTSLAGGNIPASEIEAARRDMDIRQFRQEYDASFETYAGRVIYAFSRADNVRPCPFIIGRPLLVGMDFNINPMSATVWQREDDGTLGQVDEIILPTSNTDEMADEITRRYRRGDQVSHITIYPDPAGAQRKTSAQGRTDISILRAKGFNVIASASHPLVRDRINVTNSMFCSADGHRSAFVDPKCAKSIEAYERQTYREGTGEPDKHSGYDHIVDATGYLMFSVKCPPQRARLTPTRFNLGR